MKKLIHEIHRRSLWQILGIYLVGSWIALQVVDVLVNNFELPEWFPAFALGLLVVGLPIVLATAFVQEGVAPREPVPQTPMKEAAEGVPGLRPTRRGILTWRNAILGGVGAFALWGIVAAGWLLLGGRAGAEADSASLSDLRSIAILPFSSVHTDEESAAFTSGIHDDLLTQLTKIDSLKVISRTSVMQYAGSTKTIRQIGEELGVAAVLEGGVQRSGDRVRVNVQLIEAKTDQHLWAETYDEELTAANVFAIQSDLSRKIASALRATLTPQVEERLTARPTESLEAYDLYTRARYVIASRGNTRSGVEAAMDLLQQAIAADSLFAPAHVELANAYFNLWNLGYAEEEEALPPARAAVETALALDPDLGEAHGALGALLRVERRRTEAEQELTRALELDPGSAVVHSRYSSLLLELGRPEEALREARRAVELDPLSGAARRALVARLAWTEAHDEAIAEAGKLLELDPGDADAFYYTGLSYVQMGEHDQAIEAFARAVELNPADPYYPAGLAWAHASAGDRQKALEHLKQAEALGVPLKESALVYGALGDFDRAFEYLDRAYETEPGSLGGFGVDPTADPLKADPRWDELMRKLGVG
jgi:TolB-like protein/Tfp pilus assembly protein PilF